MRRASLLIISVWALAFLAILVAAVYRMTWAHLEAARRLERKEISYQAAMSAYASVRFMLAKKTDPYDALGDLSREVTLELGTHRCTYRLVDASSKIDLSYASSAIIERLAGADEELAKVIVSAPHRPFADPAVPRHIPGVPAAFFDENAEVLTGYGLGFYNINTVSPQVMRVLGLTDGCIAAIEDFRKGEDGILGSIDDGVCKDAPSIIQTLASASGGATAELQAFEAYLTVQTDVYALEVETFVNDAPAAVYRIVFDRKGILAWHER
jgi:hypothetical protein